MFIRLSYDLEDTAPGWPGNPRLEWHRYTSMDSGDIVNHTIFTLFAHFGSHLDTSLHWKKDGLSVTDLPIEAYIYHSPVILDIPKGPKEFITVDEINAHAAALKGTDCLLIRTGFSKYRQVDPAVYSALGPALHPDAARHVIDSIPTLRAIGMDCISIASPAMVDEAIETHRVLLGYYGTRAVIILEDFSLAYDLSEIKRLFAWPLFLKGAEGGPCTIVAEVV